MSGRFSKFLSLLGIATVAASSYTATDAGTRVVSASPDTPASFGYKMSWFAVKALEARAVLTALSARDAVPANWQTGIAAAYDSFNAPGPALVYVTAPVL